MRVHQWQVERRYPPVGRFVRAGRDDLHVLEAGAGVPVVLIHGASSNLREWTASIFREVAARLEVLDSVGHMPHHVAPDTVLAAIDQLVRRRAAALSA